MFIGLCHFGSWGTFGNFGVWGWAGMILQMVLWIGMIAGVVLLIVWIIRRSGQFSPSVSGFAIANPQTAKDILQARYARGEIDREQYQQMHNDLS